MPPVSPLEKAEPVKEVCPRCHATFECRATLPIPCDCSKHTLSNATREYIQKQGYTSCLCNNCLIAIEEEMKVSN